MIVVAKSYKSSDSYERNTHFSDPNVPMPSLVQAAAVSGNILEDAILLRNISKEKLLQLKPLWPHLIHLMFDKRKKLRKETLKNPEATNNKAA